MAAITEKRALHHGACLYVASAAQVPARAAAWPCASLPVAFTCRRAPCVVQAICTASSVLRVLGDEEVRISQYHDAAAPAGLEIGCERLASQRRGAASKRRGAGSKRSDER